MLFLVFPRRRLALRQDLEAVQKDGYGDLGQYEAQMKAKRIIQEELEEKGGFVVEEIAEKIFEEKPELKTAFQDKMEKYDMVKEEVLPQSEATKDKKNNSFFPRSHHISAPLPAPTNRSTL